VNQTTVRQAFPQGRELLTLFFALALVLFIAAVSWINWAGFRRASEQIDLSRRTVRATDALLSTLTNAETGQRGFLLTGRESYLEPYTNAAPLISQNLADLTGLTAGVPDQAKRVAAVKRLVAAKLAELQQTIDLRRSQSPAAALAVVLGDEGKITMDEIRRISAEIETAADARLGAQSSQMQTLGKQLSLIGALGAAALFALLVLATAIIQRGILRRQRLIHDLHESRQLFQTTLTSIGDAVIATDTSGRITFLNTIAESLTGCTQAQAVGIPLESVFVIHHEQTGAALENPVARVLREGKVVFLSNHATLTTLDGRQVFIDDSAAPIRDAEGRLTGAVLVFRDITERRRIEANREENHALLRAFTGSSPLGFAFFDTDLRCRMINDGLARMNGLNSVVDCTVEEAFPRFGHVARELCERVRKTGLPVLDYEVASANSATPADGRHWSVTWFPVHTSNGALLGIGAVVLETTESKRAERALKAGEARLRLFIENAPASIAMFDRDMRYLVASHRWLAGYNLRFEDVVGRSAYEVVPDLPERWKEVHRRCLAGAVERSSEDSIERAGGHLEWRRWEVRPWHDDSGEIGGIVIFSEDITDRHQIEQARRDSEERYRATFDNAPVGIAHVGLDGRWLRFNNAVCAITGYSEQELSAKTFTDITHPDDIEADWALARRVLAGDFPTYSLRKRYIRKNGSIVWINLTVSVLRDASGVPQNFISIIEDITARRETEEALRDSERQLRSMVDSIDQLCWMANADGWVFWFNKRWYDYTGANPTDMEGWGWQVAVDPAVLPEALTQWTAALKTGKPFDMVLPLRGADRAFLPFLTRVNPVCGPDGNVIRWFGTHTDIHGLQRVQLALRDAEERLHLALSAGDIGTWDFNPVTGELKWDERCYSIFGVEPGSRVDYDIFLSRVHPLDRNSTHETVRHALDPAGTGEYKIDYRVLRPDGSVAWVLASGKAFFTGVAPDRHAERFIGAVVDITGRKSIEDELRRANEDLSQFAFAASHDLQEPLRIINTYSQMLLKSHRGQFSQDAELFVGFIADGTRRMRDLLDDLLAYTSFDVRTPPLIEAVDLNQIVQEVGENLALAMRESGALLTSDPLPVVQGEAAHFVQLFQNLIGNAIKYHGPQPPRIHVSAQIEEGQWRLAVSDNGMGISPEYHQKIFGVFKRLHGKQIPGTGIGLAICQKVVERYNGRIWVESESGRGATFYFTLSAIHSRGVKREIGTDNSPEIKPLSERS
jgi:PAS domain S-box-containing protein